MPNFSIKCEVDKCCIVFTRYNSFYKHVTRHHRREYAVRQNEQTTIMENGNHSSTTEEGAEDEEGVEGENDNFIQFNAWQDSSGDDNVSTVDEYDNVDSDGRNDSFTQAEIENVSYIKC